MPRSATWFPNHRGLCRRSFMWQPAGPRLPVSKRASTLDASIAKRAEQFAQVQRAKWKRVEDALAALIAAYQPDGGHEPLLKPILTLGLALAKVDVFPARDDRPKTVAGGYMQSALHT